MRTSRWWILISVVAALNGAFLSGALLRMHYEGKDSIGILAAACGEEGGGCDAVISSRWGVFPPGPAEASRPDPEMAGPMPPGAAPEGATAHSHGDDTSEKPGGVPVAALGLGYFTAVLLWLVAIGVPAWERRRWHHGLIALCGLGAIGSCFFLGIMAFAIGQWCFLCTSAHVGNFALLAGLVLARPRAAVPPESSGAEDTPAPSIAAAPHPSNRLLAVTGLLIAAALVAEYAFAKISRTAIESAQIRETLDVVKEELSAFQDDYEKLETIYFQQEKVDLEIEDDRPMIVNEKKPRMTFAYFSDLECPACASYDKFIFETIMPMYSGHLRVVFKHYPLSRHPNAIEAARAAEAAHNQGKFWEAKSYLIERRTRLKGLDYRKMAEDLGLEVERFLRDKESREVLARIRRDMRLADRLEVASTPTVYLNDRLVSKLFRKTPGFWELRSESLRKYCEERGVEW